MMRLLFMLLCLTTIGCSSMQKLRTFKTFKSFKTIAGLFDGLNDLNGSSDLNPTHPGLVVARSGDSLLSH